MQNVMRQDEIGCTCEWSNSFTTVKYSQADIWQGSLPCCGEGATRRPVSFSEGTGEGTGDCLGAAAAAGDGGRCLLLAWGTGLKERLTGDSAVDASAAVRPDRKLPPPPALEAWLKLPEELLSLCACTAVITAEVVILFGTSWFG